MDEYSMAVMHIMHIMCELVSTKYEISLANSCRLNAKTFPYFSCICSFLCLLFNSFSTRLSFIVLLNPLVFTILPFPIIPVFSFVVVPSVFLFFISSHPAFLSHGQNFERKVSPFSLRGVGYPYCYWSLFLPQVWWDCWLVCCRAHEAAYVPVFCRPVPVPHAQPRDVAGRRFMVSDLGLNSVLRILIGTTSFLSNQCL